MKHDRMFVISQQHVLNILDGDEESAFAFVAKCGVSRSFPKLIDLKGPVHEILCEISEKGNIRGPEEYPHRIYTTTNKEEYLLFSNLQKFDNHKYNEAS